MANNLRSATELLERYPWWSAQRLAVARNSGEAWDEATKLIAMLHPTALIAPLDIDADLLKQESAEDIIDRFLKLDDYRIVAKDGSDEDLAAKEIDADDELVSEEIAEIYKNQGLYDQAIATYRKLSLLNSEKSIYFARLIREIEDLQKK